MEKELSPNQKTFLKDVAGQEKRLRSLKNETITHAAEISELQKE
jgi:cell division protein FtsB